MKKNIPKKKSQPDYEAEIRKVIMATDAVLHLDWEKRLALYMEQCIEEENEANAVRQAWFYRGIIVMIITIFIGWYAFYGRCNHPRLDEIKAQYELKNEKV